MLLVSHHHSSVALPFHIIFSLGAGLLVGEGRNASGERQGRKIGGMSTGGLRSLGRNLKSDLKEGQEDLGDLLFTTISGESGSSSVEGQGNARSFPSEKDHLNLDYLPQIPLGPHVNLSAFGAEGVSGSQYQSLKQVLTPLQALVSFFGGGDIMCQVFPSTCLPSHLPRRKRSPRKRKPGKGGKHGSSKKSFFSGGKVRVKHLPHIASAGGKFFTGSLNNAQTLLGIVNRQEDRRMSQQYRRMHYRPQPPVSQPPSDYDY